jgi:hypothetical protein
MRHGILLLAGYGCAYEGEPGGMDVVYEMQAQGADALITLTLSN